MSLIYSPQDAALLAAGRLTVELVQRYCYSLEKLIKHEQPRQILERRIDQLESLDRRLTAAILAAELLPREPDLEMRDLHTLADQFSSWLDDDACHGLLARFAESERELLEELEKARATDDDRRNQVIEQALRESREHLAELERG